MSPDEPLFVNRAFIVVVGPTTSGRREEERAQMWQVATIPVVVLVVPTIPFSREWISWHAVVRGTVETLRSACARHSGKILLLGGHSNCADEFHLDAYVEDIADVVAAVEKLTWRAGAA